MNLGAFSGELAALEKSGEKKCHQNQKWGK
jgi:hypothetical protein